MTRFLGSSGGSVEYTLTFTMRDIGVIYITHFNHIG